MSPPFYRGISPSANCCQHPSGSQRKQHPSVRDLEAQFCQQETVFLGGTGNLEELSLLGISTGESQKSRSMAFKLCSLESQGPGAAYAMDSEVPGWLSYRQWISLSF